MAVSAKSCKLMVLLAKIVVKRFSGIGCFVAFPIPPEDAIQLSARHIIDFRPVHCGRAFAAHSARPRSAFNGGFIVSSAIAGFSALYGTASDFA